MPGWLEQDANLTSLARSQLFFVGGAPRSGTTRLQSLLDAHPDICCRGEALFQKHLAEPLDRMMAERRAAVQAKNDAIFRHSGGFPLPDQDDAAHLLATGVLLGLARACVGAEVRAVGEKTPENVFLFPTLKRLFPGAKFIGIARDPRDVLASAWHFFHEPAAGEDAAAAKMAFIRLALPSLQQGARAMLSLREQYPADCALVTYEQMLRTTAPVAAALFRFLGVSDAASVVDDCVARTSFAALTGGRPAGQTLEKSFFRKGVAGDWGATFSAEMGAAIVRELGWTFPAFGWTV